MSAVVSFVTDPPEGPRDDGTIYTTRRGQRFIIGRLVDVEALDDGRRQVTYWITDQEVLRMLRAIGPHELARLGTKVHRRAA